MQTFKQRDALQNALDEIRDAGQKIGLVPTMGNLHAGHLALVDAAKKQCDFVIATIFVNPLQFGPNEDLDNYPRTLDADIEKLESHGCHAVFIPGIAEMYPSGLENQTLVTVPGLSEHHCGQSRPRHFSGVCTVVCKLFNLIRPDLALFGEKDYQQLLIIRKMSSDLCLPVSIIGVPTVRLENGLAMSSRNNYLDDNQLRVASTIYSTLKSTAAEIHQGNRDYPALEQAATILLGDVGLRTDYFHISQADTLASATVADTRLVLLAAVWAGPTRLIDNLQVSLTSN